MEEMCKFWKSDIYVIMEIVCNQMLTHTYVGNDTMNRHRNVALRCINVCSTLLHFKFAYFKKKLLFGFLNIVFFLIEYFSKHNCFCLGLNINYKKVSIYLYICEVIYC